MYLQWHVRLLAGEEQLGPQVGRGRIHQAQDDLGVRCQQEQSHQLNLTSDMGQLVDS